MCIRDRSDTDPKGEGLPIDGSQPDDRDCAKAQKAAKLIGGFYEAARPLLAGLEPTNGFLMRGIAHQPDIPMFAERYAMRPGGGDVDTRYKGRGQIVGMTEQEGAQTVEEQ